MKRRTIAVFILTGLVASAASATDYYASSIHPNRSDSNSGTSANAPWATFDKVKSKWSSLNAGDTVHLERGSAWDLSFSGDWYISTGGTAQGGPVTLRGDDYGSGTKPVLRRTGGSGTCAFISIQKSNVTIQDIELDGGNNTYGKNTSGMVVGGYNQDISNVYVLNMKINNLGGGLGEYVCGIWVGSSTLNSVSDCLIEGNEVSDYSAHGLNNYNEGGLTNIIWRNNIVRNSYAGGRYPSANSALQINSGASGCVFENNYLEDTTTTEGIIILFGKWGNASSVNAIRFNVIANSSVQGIHFYYGAAGTGHRLLYDVYGNIIYNCKKSGVAFNPQNSYGAGTYIKIYNNTFFNNCTTGGDGNRGDMEVDSACANTTIDFVNNLIFHRNYSSTVGLVVRSGFNGTFTHRNNLYWHEGGTTKNIITHSQTYTVANALSYESTAKNTDPKFNNTAQVPTAVSYASGATPNGLSVQSTSPTIGAGANLGSSYALDINRTARIVPWDIGSCQFTASGGEPQIPAPPSRPRVILDI